MNVGLHPQPAEAVNLISLCTGGGGLDLGLELALPSARSVVMVEREAFAVAHLVAAIEQRLLAPAAIWSDVRTFDGRPWRGLVDGLIGGIPCQPHSLAGKKRGSLDGRDLWSDTRRIIATARPWFVVIENVRGMLSAGADEVAGAERVWRDLRKLGYAVELGLFTAAEVGASHLRPRIFILAVADPRRSEWWTGDERGRDTDWAETGRHEGSGRAAEPGSDVANAERDGRRQEFAQERSVRALVNADHGAFEIGQGDAIVGGGWPVESARDRSAGLELGLYPPGPADLDGWRRVLAHSPDLEPSVRRMADGVAARLDLSGPHAARVDRLRMLGNGVVSLEAAYAFRTLVSRLAATGHAGAAELTRLMEVQGK